MKKTEETLQEIKMKVLAGMTKEEKADYRREYFKRSYSNKTPVLYLVGGVLTSVKPEGCNVVSLAEYRAKLTNGG